MSIKLSITKIRTTTPCNHFNLVLSFVFRYSKQHIYSAFLALKHQQQSYFIKTIHIYEIHYENIYTGVCDVCIQTIKQWIGWCIYPNVGFTTDLNLALQFRGDSGVVIGQNMKRIYNERSSSLDFVACDVSWIYHKLKHKTHNWK